VAALYVIGSFGCCFVVLVLVVFAKPRWLIAYDRPDWFQINDRPRCLQVVNQFKWMMHHGRPEVIRARSYTPEWAKATGSLSTT
jgi:hypothetical protein